MELKQGVKAYIQMPVEVKTIDKDLGTLEAIFSTQDVDRHGDIVMQEGWDLKNFKKNPVILNSHNYNDAAEVIGKASNVRTDGKKLLGDITFAVAENPKAKVIFDLYAGGFLNAFSVGFIPKKFKENKDGTTDWYTIEEAELLEVSAVSVPANARALAKAKGIEVETLEDNEEENDNTKIEEDKQIPEDTEDEENNESGVAGDNSDSESESGESGEASESDVEDDDEDTIDNYEADIDEDIEEKSVTYKKKVVNAIKGIQNERKMKLLKVKSIIDSILKDDPRVEKINKHTQRMVHKRKINQAVRVLLQSK